MSIAWQFKEARPGDRARESQVEKFFNSDAVMNRANAIVREGIQNSLDAAPDETVVTVRIAIGFWTEANKSRRLINYTGGFSEHFNIDAVRSKIANPPDAGDEFRYLTFEDFGTSGLLGDPAQWWLEDHGDPNPFFNYFRAEGISDKIDGKRGRHGVGRLVFMFASRIHSIFALTSRVDGRQLLMGTSVLRNHRVNDTPYLPDGWFGIPSDKEQGLTLPVEDSAFLDQFKGDFGIMRQNDQSGLSVVVPWLASEVTVAGITRAVLKEYFYPILRKKLVVEIVDENNNSTSIDARTIKSVIESQNGDLAREMEPVLALAEASLVVPETDQLGLVSPPDSAPRWSNACITGEVLGKIHSKIEGGEIVALRIPLVIRSKDSKTSPCKFHIYLQRDQAIGESQIIFIREGIIISDLRPRRTSGFRALIVVDEGPLATFLGDAENPSHTQWQRELVRDKYSFHGATIDYVVQSVPSILAMMSEDQKKPDSSLLIDLFSLPVDEDIGLKIKRRKKTKEVGESEGEEIDPEGKPKRFFLDKFEDGFAIRRGDPKASRPQMLSIRFAYGVRRGSPFSKYNPADFRVGLGNVKPRFEGCESSDFDNNWMLVRVTDDNFKIEVTGFDTNRDLHVDAKVKEEEVADAPAT